MKKIIAVFFMIILGMTVLSKPAYVQALPTCSSSLSLSCVEYQNAVELNWNDIGEATSYSIYWRNIHRPVCSLSDPPSACGSISSGSGTTSALITPADELIQGDRYSFIVQANGCYAAGGSSFPTVDITCTPTICGDSIKGTSEVCDGTDFGTATCQKSGFESGSLQCISSCQLNTSQCLACNNLTSVSFSNDINSLSVAAQGANFKCLVNADRQGPAVACSIYTSSSSPTKVSNCNFDSWSNNTATFICTAPTTINSYQLKAEYPLYSPTTSGTLATGVCTASYVAKFSNNFQVIAPDTTPPQVSVQEQYQNYLDENPLSELKVKLNCNDSGSGCDDSSFKLKRFDTDPGACPADYSQYNLSQPDTPAALKTVWYCASAKDRLGNAGFSSFLEVRPGCRDQCQAEPDLMCRELVPPVFGYQDSTNCRSNFDSDACYEWGSPERCPEYACRGGICLSSSSSPFGDGYVWYDQNGDGQRGGEPGIDGVEIAYRVASGYGGTILSYSNGYFPMTIETVSSSNLSLHVLGSLPGWQQTTTLCKVYRKKCLEGDPDIGCTLYAPCSDPFVEDHASGLNCNNLPSLDFDYYTESEGYCGPPAIGFGFTKTDLTAPTFTGFTIDPPDPFTTQQITFTVTGHDSVGLHQIEIFVDQALVTRCVNKQRASPSPDLTCSFTGEPFSAGNHLVKAVALDNANNQSQTQTTFTVTASTPSVTGCATGAPARATGLVSTPNLISASRFLISPTGACIYDPKAAFVPYKIPTFDDLKSLYYDQKR